MGANKLAPRRGLFSLRGRRDVVPLQDIADPSGRSLYSLHSSAPRQYGRTPMCDSLWQIAQLSPQSLDGNVLFCVAGFRPGKRGPFVSAKGPKTIDARSGLIK